MMKYLLALPLLLIPLSVFATPIFMQNEPDGSTSYSDTQTNGAQPVDLTNQPGVTQLKTSITSDANAPATTTKTSKKTSTATTTPGTPTSAVGAVTAEEHQPYTEFSMTSPTDQLTFQNQREIPVVLSIKPDLQKGDKIILFLDGKQIGDPATTTKLMLHQVERGTHTVSAELVNNNYEILKQTGSVTIFIHYAALGGGGG